MSIKEFLHFLLSHHTPDRYCRTFTLRIGKSEVHFCARCTSMYFGVAVTLLLTFSEYVFVPPCWIRDIFPSLLALPAVIDWVTQTLGMRESRNSIRAATGFMLGMGIVYIKFANMLYVTITIIVYLAVYGIAIVNHDKFAKRFRKHYCPMCGCPVYGNRVLCPGCERKMRKYGRVNSYEVEYWKEESINNGF